MTSLNTLRFIVSLSTSNPVASEVLRYLASRQRNRHIESVRRLVQICGKGTPRSAVVAVLRKLETNGFGRLIVGRKGYESRFIWKAV